MSVFKEFFENKVLFTAVLAWLCAQVLKVLLTLVLSKKLNIERLVGWPRGCPCAFFHGMRTDHLPGTG